MTDYVLIDGDVAVFQPSFGAATVVVPPGQLSASGPATKGGKKICVEGDESSISVSGCLYVTPQYSIPGSGTVTISSLASDQVAEHTVTGGTPVMLKGGQFDAKFEVSSPAQQPSSPSPIPDSTTSYGGNGSFVTTNTTLQAT